MSLSGKSPHSHDEKHVIVGEKDANPFASLDARNASVIDAHGEAITLVTTEGDADEALLFLEKHPQAAQVAAEGTAMLEDPTTRKRLIRKIDMTIAPLLAAVYFLQFLDKTTLSYTAVMGIRSDTHLVGQDYSNLGMLFYVGFLAAEFPTQYIAQHISKLGIYLGVNIMLWGVVLGFHGACTTYAGLAISRTRLGVFESCVAPILVLIIAMWYRKEEQGRRVSWFYVCNALTQIFGGFVAYGVSFTHGKFASWRIFYIAIGVMTVVIGFLVCIFLPDSPVKAKRFTDAEKVAVLLRVKDNQRQALASIPIGRFVLTVLIAERRIPKSRNHRSSKLCVMSVFGLSVSAPCCHQSRMVVYRTSRVFFSRPSVIPHSKLWS